MISLIHPSRGRPERAFKTYSEWMVKSSCEHEIEHIVSVDVDDPTLSQYQSIFSGKFVCNGSDNVVAATNNAAQYATGDILLYLSDDFQSPQNWDKLIVDAFGERITEPCCLKVDDCLQPFHVAVLTIPIITRALYEKLGYFWHPEYKSMFVDEHLYWTCKENGWLLEAKQLKFEHRHPANGKADNDETYRRSANNWDQGKALFAKHKSQGFKL